MSALPRSISKTSFLAGCQCPKLLWIKLCDPDKLPPVDETTQAVFDTGHQIGALAKSLYPDGVEVGDGGKGGRVIEDTQAMLKGRVPLFEPAFAHDGGFVRVDILVPDEEGDGWHLVEVKSGTKVKDVNVLDVAFQKDVCEGAGEKISRCSLMHVNNKYVRSGEIVAEELLALEDITGEVDALLPSIPETRAEFLEGLKAESAPEVAIGPHCNSPYSCDLQYLCWGFLPEHPVTDLYRDNKGLRWEMLGQGIDDIGDIPDSASLNAKQVIQVTASRSGQPQVDRERICQFIDGLEYPIAHFDLESFQMAVPPFDGKSHTANSHLLRFWELCKHHPQPYPLFKPQLADQSTAP